MQTEFRCPLCRAVIAPEDVNVATDLALCRSCGRTSSALVVSGLSGISSDAVAAPPRCIKVERDSRGGTTIVYSPLSPSVILLILFTAFWSGFSMWGIYGTQFKKGVFDLHETLFGIPFLIGTIILLGIITFILFGRWRITLRSGIGSVFTGVGSLGWTRRFAYNRNTVVSMRMTDVRVNEVPQKGILVRTDGKDFVFGSMLKEDAKSFIASSIMKAVAEV